MLIKFDFSSKTGILVVKFAFTTANLKIELAHAQPFCTRVFLRWVLIPSNPQYVKRSLLIFDEKVFFVVDYGL